MRAIHLTAAEPSAFQPVDLPDPSPGPGEVLVRLTAAALNYVDWAVASGGFPGVTFPLVPVTDAAGVVAAVGDGVADFRSGDRVIPHFKPFWTTGPLDPRTVNLNRGVNLPGSLADLVTVPATGLISTPAGLSDQEAATLPIAATTAWRAVRAASLGPGSVALLLGTGGVSLFALQFAKASGAHVILTSSSDEKLERAKALGADDVINYRTTPQWDEQVLRLTAGRGADLVLETGGGDTLARSVNAAAPEGVVFVIGFLSGATPTLNVLPLLGRGVRLQGNNTGSVADLAQAARAINAHSIRPVIDQVFERGAAAEAYARLGQGRHFGKIGLSQ